MTRNPRDGYERRLRPAELLRLMEAGRWDEIGARLDAEAVRPRRWHERLWGRVLENPVLPMMVVGIAYVIKLDVDVIESLVHANDSTRWGYAFVACFFVIMTVQLIAITVMMTKINHLFHTEKRPVLPRDGALPAEDPPADHQQPDNDR